MGCGTSNNIHPDTQAVSNAAIIPTLPSLQQQETAEHYTVTQEMSTGNLSEQIFFLFSLVYFNFRNNEYCR